MKKLKALWASMWADVDRRVRMGRILGLAFVVIGFIMIAKAWDGAASQQFVQQMIPYLLSGGFMGLGVIVLGCVLLFLATVRAERQELTARYEEMTTLLSRNLSRLALSANGASSTGEQVVAGATAYHRAGCRVLQGKEGLMTVSLEQAAAEGLEACRVCDPPRLPETAEEAVAAETQPAQSESTSGAAETEPAGAEPAAEPSATEPAASGATEKPGR